MLNANNFYKYIYRNYYFIDLFDEKKKKSFLVNAITNVYYICFVR